MGKTIRKEQIVYASTNCPVVEGLQPGDKGIKLKAKAIEIRGIFPRITLWERPDGLYETVYGDDVLVAYFDVLGHKEIDKQFVNPFDYRDPVHLRYAKGMLWRENPNFGTLEKGRWIYNTLKMEMDVAGLDIEEDWNDWKIRKEYVENAAVNFMISTRSLNLLVNRWLKIPKEDRPLIMDSAEDLRKQ